MNMKQSINKNLITLKCVLFCFLSGIGCIFPFLPLHPLALGLNKSEARIIAAVAPCVALLGPAILGPLLDKLSVGRGSITGIEPSGSGRLLRITTALCLVLSAVFTLLLQSVPYVERHEARRPSVLFMCDSEGAYVMQEVCTEGMRCNRWDGEKSGVLAMTMCEYGCADDNMTWITQPFPTTTTTTTIRPIYFTEEDAAESLTAGEEGDDMVSETNPPHLCTGGKCHVYLQHAARMRLPLTLIAPQDADNETQWCTYKTSGPSQCLVPEDRLEELKEKYGSCRPAVRCQVLDPYDEPDGVLADAQCQLTIGDPDYTFWTYFILRVLADIWPISALALLGTACVIATRETSLGRGDVGRQLAFGTLGLAIFPPLAGLASSEFPKYPYLIPFLMHSAFMLLAALILLLDNRMPLSTPEWWWHTSTGVLTMPMNAIRRYGAETAAIFAVLTLLGIFWSAIDSYLPWTIMDLQGTDPLVGLTMTIGALPAIPALWWAETVVDYLGHSNVLIAAFAFYCLRLTGLGVSSDYSWVLGCEVLEVFTLSLVWVTAILYFRHLVPRKFTATGQALPVIAHFCIGRCIGSIIGGLVSASTGGEGAALQAVWRALGAAALLVAAAYLALYHLLLAPKCRAPSSAPPTALLEASTIEGQIKELNANGRSNGNYSPMRVYHEERARKGQFRY